VWKCCGVSRRSSDDETQQVLVRVTIQRHGVPGLAWRSASGRTVSGAGAPHGVIDDVLGHIS
jgi:hypothetical protein